MSENSGGPKPIHPNSLKALEENRAATQFNGERANPQCQNAGSNKPWSVRGSLRDFANRRADSELYARIKDMDEDEAIKLILPIKNPTLVEIGSARQLVRFAKGKGNEQFITEQLDGKLAQTNISADFAAIQGMSDDELLRLANGVDDAAATRGGPSGNTETTGSPGPVENEVESSGKAGDTPGL